MMHWYVMVLMVSAAALLAGSEAGPDGVAAQPRREGGAFFGTSRSWWQAPPPAQPRREVLMIVRQVDDAEVSPGAGAGAQPAAYDSERFISAEQAAAWALYYQSFLDHPLQVWVPSEHGPVPLFNDIVHDAEGRPQPRLPDPWTYLAMTHPTYHNIAAWQSQRQGALRQFRVAQGMMVPVAEDLGIVGPEHLQVQRGSTPGAFGIGSRAAINPETRGTAIYDDQQARILGMRPDEVPVTPGPANDIEVMWFWDHRCEWSLAAAGCWARFADVVNQAGYKALGVSLDNDVPRIAAQLEFWILKGLPFEHTLNVQDVTNLRQTLAITTTPTYVFINRRSGQMRRHEGMLRGEELRALFWATLEQPPGSWPPPAAHGAPTTGSPPITTTSARSLPNRKASAALPPSHPESP